MVRVCRPALFLVSLLLLDLNPSVAQDTNAAGYLPFTSFYNSGWQTLEEGECVTLEHNLGGTYPNLHYMVFLYGTADTGEEYYDIHQAHYGEETLNWWGCKWDSLDASTIRICRGPGDNWAPPENRWRQFRVLIIRLL
jgi:hypothetical protein